MTGLAFTGTDVAADPVVAPCPAAETYQRAARMGELLAERVRRAPQDTAIRVPGEQAWTWAELAAEVARVQRGLAEAGVGPGDHVAMLCDNGLRTAATLAAVLGMGAVLVPVNTALVGRGLAFVLSDAAPAAVIGDPEHLARARATGALPDGAAQVCTAGEGGDGVRTWETAFARDGELVVAGAGRDPAMIMYTSGTTGDAKGVVLSHTAVLAGSFASAAVMFEATDDDVIYTSLPLYHCAAQQLGLWTSFLSGAELLLGRRFSASRFWGHVRDYGVTAFHFVGPLLSVLWQAEPRPDDADHGARLAVGGGPRVAWREFEERFGVTAVECYGMTETFGGCVTHRPAHGRLGTVGKAMGYVEVAVADDEGTHLPAGERGNVLIRGRVPDVLFSGYHGRPDLTEAAFRDGWYVTGDLGALDADGYLTFGGRARDIVRRRGENISLVAVEDVLAEHPAVADCALVGVPAELGEDELLAVVVAATEVSPDELRAHAGEHLPAFAVPRYVAFADHIPRTATERTQRHLLRPLLDGADDGERR